MLDNQSNICCRYTGANLVKKNSSKGGSGGGGGEALTTLQKRALDLTGAPLISYSNGGAADKERAYRSQSLNPDPTGIPSGPHDSGIQQLQQQMLFLRQLQAAQQQQLQQFPRYDVYDSGRTKRFKNCIFPQPHCYRVSLSLLNTNNWARPN